MNSMNQKYADVLVNYCLNLTKGDRVLIKGGHIAEPLLLEVYKEALKAGAHPQFEIFLNGAAKIFYDYAGEDQLKDISPTRKYIMENYDALINILSPFNLKELQNVDPKKKKIVNLAGAEISKTYMKRASDGSLKWNVCQFPCDPAAQESGMSIFEYQDFVYNACFLYESDPVSKWNEVHDSQQKMVDLLDKKKKIRYKGNDIDVEFSTEGRIWINSDGHHNMPSGEVFTSPVEDSVNGKIRFSYPAIFMGQEIEDITLEIKDGEIIKWNAKHGQDFLDQIFQIPGATRFGECAIGTNYGITKFTKNILFDEKLGGTIHMAVGASFPIAGGKNECAIHLDFIADMKTNSEIYADDELIYKDGKFLG